MTAVTVGRTATTDDGMQIGGHEAPRCRIGPQAIGSPEGAGLLDDGPEMLLASLVVWHNPEA